MVLDRQFATIFSYFLPSHLLYQRETLISCVFHHNSKNLQLGRMGHARILLFRSALVIFVSAVVTTVVTVLKTVIKRCNCSRSKSHFIRYCCVLLETVTRSFVYTIGFFHNGGTLTSSNLDQRSAKFGSADTRCEQLIVVVLFVKIRTL